MMEEMFEQAAHADALGFDWISFSEHHYAPLLVLTPNPFVFAAAAIQHIRRAKIALFGPILPLHNPIHVAEEIAMLDVLSGGRLLLLFLRGVPYELRAFSVNLDEARAMTQEATLLITRALTDPQPFSWEGTYYRYPTVAVWPGLLQRPHPPLYSTGNSFASATFAASHGHGLALSFAPLSYIAQAIPHYQAEAARYGWEPQRDQVVFRGNLIATETDEEAQQLATQLAAMPHLKRPQSAPTVAASTGSGNRVSLTAPVLLNQAQFCGSPQTLVSQMKALSDLGVGVVDLVVPTGLMSQAQVLHSLELLAREVLPHIHALGGD
jgi:alkanesulfonate monooxygenase SsuD/methylene tetrahydromethanopterin reductase-like flavin-dependent oxidoreductase (luciferase family)